MDDAYIGGRSFAEYEKIDQRLFPLFPGEPPNGKKKGWRRGFAVTFRRKSNLSVLVVVSVHMTHHGSDKFSKCRTAEKTKKL